MSTNGVEARQKSMGVNPTAKLVVLQTLKKNRVGPILQRIASLSQNDTLSPVLVSRLVAMDKSWEAATLAVVAESLVYDIDLRLTNITQIFNALPHEAAILTIHAGAMVVLAQLLLARSELKPADFLAHMGATVRLTRLFAGRMGQPADKLALTAVYHDLGFLAMASQEPEQYDAFPELLAGSPDSLVQHERGQFKTDHAEVGALLLRALQFPDYVVQGTAHHHDTAQGTSLATHLVQLADAVALQYGCHMGLGNAGFGEPKPPAGLELDEDLVLLAGQQVSAAAGKAALVYSAIEP